MKFLIFLCVVMVSACGMQGDLYLPDEEPVKDKAAKNQPAQNQPAENNTTQETNKGS